MRSESVAIAGLALAAAGGVSAQGLAGLAPCAAAEFGKGGCTAEGALEALGALSPGDFRPFREAGMESFAMAYVLTRLARGIDGRLRGDCDAGFESVYEAREVWDLYVASPPDASPELAARVDGLDRFVGRAADFIEGGC